ncbi:MAG: sucrose-6-phosphate hydrolase [Planctomycetes bacterium]|nr:sucrose-6-phosphate hydrolase [Planctomycetota bacterium]
MDLVAESTQRLEDVTVMMLSAGGRNPDVMGATRSACTREPRQLLVLCGAIGSPLADLALSYDADVFEYPPPGGKDGFLATNTLIAFSLLLYRGYRAVSGLPSDLPPKLSQLLDGVEVEDASAAVDNECRRLWDRDTLVVLHGPSTRSAALDLESKFTEGALGTVQLADFRNYAHGRHHWLAKRASSSAVLALVTGEDEDLAARTLALLPRNEVPIVRLRVKQESFVASMTSLVKIMFVVASAGRARGIDPGRPSVPAFGRKLYHLRAFSPRATRSWETAAIERKAGEPIATLETRGELEKWRDALNSFVDTLRSTNFGALVLDYDGTICDRHARFRGLDAPVAEQLNRLLRSGLVLGIATGRGKSVRKDLAVCLEKRYHHRVWIGYYNGGHVRKLDEDLDPLQLEGSDDPLPAVQRALAADAWISAHTKIKAKRMQLSVVRCAPVSETVLWESVAQLIATEVPNAVSVVRSSHSVDVLAPGVSKRSLVERVRRDLPEERAILCIGDRGRWPGNDYSLLQEPCSLSADEVSPDPRTCWNLATPGVRGVSATLRYLRALTVKKGTARFTINEERAP